MALQVRARDVGREFDKQELLWGDGTSLRLEIGGEKLGYCRSWHLGAVIPVLWCYTYILERNRGAPRL